MDEQELVMEPQNRKEGQPVQNDIQEKQPEQNVPKSPGQLRLERELEEDRLHQERHAKRIEKMKREKQRQAELRSKMKLYAGIAAGCLCLIAVFVVGLIVIHTRKADLNQNTVSADQEADSGLDTSADNYDMLEEADAAGASAAQTADGDGADPAADSDPERGDAISSGGDGANGMFYSGYTAEITEDTPYLSNEEVISSYVILLDLDTGEVVAQRDAKAVISPASMTKILTLLVAAEHVTDLDDTFTMTLDITDYAYVNDCSTAGFLENEVVTVRDLMYGTILPSGGEAAAALAVYTAGSLDAFVDMMNDKLEELGLSGSAHFTNCVGLYDENHHCSVYDMAMILKAAAENDLCREVLSAHTYTTSATEQHPEGIILSNWFLRRIEDKDTHGEVICAKTGFVNQSGNCGASYAISNSGKHYICVTANAWSSWRCIYDQVAIYQEYTD